MIAKPFHIVLVWLGALSLLLSGCGTDEPEDVREWMRTNSANLKGKIPDLPQIKPLPAVAYDPGDMASPFVPEKLVGAELKAMAKGLGPEQGLKSSNPDAYPLSRVPLENIRMVGTLTVGKNTVALVTSDRDSPRQIKVGDYIGINFGRVVAIRESSDQGEGEIIVKEMLLDKGSWVERENRITQPVQGEKK